MTPYRDRLNQGEYTDAKIKAAQAKAEAKADDKSSTKSDTKSK